MLTYLVRRLITMAFTLLIISALVFTIIKLPPGDYLTTYIEELRAQGEAVNQGRIDYLRQRYGLDQPGWMQYLNWMGGLVRGDLGWSFEYDQPVAQVIGETLVRAASTAQGLATDRLEQKIAELFQVERRPGTGNLKL